MGPQYLMSTVPPLATTRIPAPARHTRHDVSLLRMVQYLMQGRDTYGAIEKLYQITMGQLCRLESKPGFHLSEPPTRDAYCVAGPPPSSPAAMLMTASVRESTHKEVLVRRLATLSDPQTLHYHFFLIDPILLPKFI
jgi:hypothetical protein